LGLSLLEFCSERWKLPFFIVFVRLLKSPLEKWGAVNVTAQVEEADAILPGETESRIVPAKVVVKRIDAQVRRVDHHSH
jgi:hypothetical protein